MLFLIIKAARQSFGVDACGGCALAFASQRDNETGLDYFAVRHFSSINGRFTSPDPLLASGRAEAPQSWNRYSYVLNNPLKLVDPLGLYEFDENVDPTQRENFRASLEQARKNLDPIKKLYGSNSDEYRDAKAAVDVYGCERGAKGCSEANGNNGVMVGVAAQAKGAEGSVDILDGGKILVSFSASVMNSSEMSGQIGHEGSHAVDTINYLRSGTSVTDYDSEFRAFTTQSVMVEATGYARYDVRTEPTTNRPSGTAFQLYDEGWRKADKATLSTLRAKRTEAINKILAVPKAEGGLYELTPGSTRRDYYRPRQ